MVITFLISETLLLIMTSSSSPLSFHDVSCVYAGQDTTAVERFSASVMAQSITGIIGPNGAGKSTLIKAALGLLPYEGDITIAPNAAYIPQRKDIDWDFPVSALDVCLMGLYSKIGWLRRITKVHKQEAMQYLEKVKLADFAHRPIGALSGGQQQRVFMARALAQQSDLFLLDEPMAGVDQKTQALLFELFETLKNDGKTIVIVHHNLAAAQKHFDDVLLMNKVLIAQGKPQDVLTTENLNKAYGL